MLDGHQDDADESVVLDGSDDEPEAAAKPRDLRSRRKREVRARTISLRASKLDLSVGAALYPEQPGIDYARPRTRAECAEGIRPCPFVSCTYNLYLDVTKAGGVKLNFPDLDPHEMNDSCALDIADDEGATLERVASLMNMTRERIRQVEVKGINKVKANGGRDLAIEIGLIGGSRARRKA